MERDSFIFYRSFYEAIRILPRDVQGEIYTAIMEYGLYGKETEQLKPIARSVFMLVKPVMDSNNVRYDNGCKGGAPVGNSNNPNGRRGKNQPRTNQELTENKPYEDEDVDDDKETSSNEEVKKPPHKKPLDFDSRKNAFMNNCAAFVEKYGQKTIREFFDYWTEPNKSKSKMRFELEKTWDLARRLTTWSNNDLKFNKNGTNQKSGRPTTEQLNAAVEAGFALANAAKKDE